jgi:S1-C subfamily serine protease
MKLIVLGLLAVVFATGAARLSPDVSVKAGSGFPLEAVRAISDSDGSKFCSSVVIAPGVALTAKHCVAADLRVDSRKVSKIVMPADYKDIAVLHVPGLVCPCVPLGVRPAKGDQVLAVGFPVDRNGERTVSPVARIRYVGALKEEFGILGDFPQALEDYIITDAAIITHGYSGGALLAMQGGEWKVVGINAVGVPEGPCVPFLGCGKEVASGFVPVDVAKGFL